MEISASIIFSHLFGISLALAAIFVDVTQGEVMKSCDKDRDCENPLHVCRSSYCSCISCDAGEKCGGDVECLTPELVCQGKGEAKVCRCRKTYVWDLKYGCIKDDSYAYDPVQNLIIPAIVVMSVGAMVYLGIKLFCNCGKLWRRRQSHLSRELDSMTSSGHQQATWVASYRVFSPISNPNQPQLHHPPPCMGYFMPNISAGPPPYEEALKHKVILSSYTTVPTPAPVYTPTVVPDQTPVAVHHSANRYTSNNDRDHTIQPLRYYPGEGNPEVPAVWNSGRTRIVEREEVLLSEEARPRPVRTNTPGANRLSTTRQYSNVIERTNSSNCDPTL